MNLEQKQIKLLNKLWVNSQPHRQKQIKLLNKLWVNNQNPNFDCKTGKIAITHPGKLGDAIYSLPTIRWLCQQYGTKADFWTSSYCRPLKELFEYQTEIDTFNVCHNYTISNYGCGVQPWFIPIPEKDYINVYHLGFRDMPHRHLPDYMAMIVGAPLGLPLKYEYPNIETLDKYIVVAPRGERHFAPFIEEVAKIGNVVQVGALNDKVTNAGIDKTGLTFLETLSWIANAKAFYGCKSSQLVIAEGFPMPKHIGPGNVQTAMREFTA